MTLPSCGLKAGDALGHFQVERLIGRGSFGYVVCACNLRDACEVAMKIVPCDQLDTAAANAAKEVALSEAALLKRFGHHPNIVTCYENAWDAGRSVVWMALEYMEGGDIQSVLAHRVSCNEGPLEATFLRSVLVAIGSALRFIHQEGVLHRDVKPGNLLLSRKGLQDPSPMEIKLADFGVAIVLDATTAAKTTGTPHYMSPEMVCGESYSAASDAWALGVCLYEMASLRRPFEANNQLALAKQIVDECEKPLPEACSQDLQSVITRLLTKDAKERLDLAEAVRFSEEIRSCALGVRQPLIVEELESGKNSPRSIVSSLPDIPCSVATLPNDVPSSISGSMSWWRSRGRKQSLSSPKSGAWCLPDNHAVPQKEKKGGSFRSSWFNLFRRGTKIAQEPSIDDTLESTTVVSTFSHTEESNDSCDISKRPSLKALKAWN